MRQVGRREAHTGRRYDHPRSDPDDPKNTPNTGPHGLNSLLTDIVAIGMINGV
ncbi:hypothetical protein L842_5031 [Mycobacterium intracellulare MIN_052511_1280]|nr:hypothetical protein L842_5031 [Mycobacterium intracellulare MIN_052511_1280]